MGLYLYRHPETNEVREISQSIHAEHVYYDDNGLKWEREFTIPTASIDVKIDPMKRQEFVEKTKKKNYNVGQMWDLSQEMSDKRERQMGRDEVKEKEMTKYEKKCKGKKHPGRIKRKDVWEI